MIIFHLLLNLHDFQKAVEINISSLSPNYLQFYILLYPYIKHKKIIKIQYLNIFKYQNAR